MKSCYQQSLEQDLQDCQALIAAYEIKVQNQNDYIRIMERMGKEREAKLGLLEKNLEALEIEALKLAMEIEANREH